MNNCPQLSAIVQMFASQKKLVRPMTHCHHYLPIEIQGMKQDFHCIVDTEIHHQCSVDQLGCMLQWWVFLISYT